MEADLALNFVLLCVLTFHRVVGTPLPSINVGMGHTLSEAAQAGADTSKVAAAMKEGKLGRSGFQEKGESEATNNMDDLKDWRNPGQHSSEDDGSRTDTSKEAGLKGTLSDDKPETLEHSRKRLSNVIVENLAAQNEEVERLIQQGDQTRSWLENKHRSIYHAMDYHPPATYHETADSERVMGIANQKTPDKQWKLAKFFKRPKYRNQPIPAKPKTLRDLMQEEMIKYGGRAQYINVDDLRHRLAIINASKN